MARRWWRNDIRRKHAWRAVDMGRRPMRNYAIGMDSGCVWNAAIDMLGWRAMWRRRRLGRVTVLMRRMGVMEAVEVWVTMSHD
jgi:hypothetical protein